MFGKKKKAYGIAPKVRDRTEVDRDYQHYAIQAGHTARCIAQLQEDHDRFIQKLIEINQEGMRLPPVEPPKESETIETKEIKI